MDRYSIFSPKLKRRHRFVFLSDMHEKEFGKGNIKLLRKIYKEKPDFVLIGGDMIVSEKGGKGSDRIEKTIELINNLKKRYTIYYALGNHEQRFFDKARGEGLSAAKYRDFIKALEGCVLLDRKSLSFEGALSDLMISGVSLPKRFYRSLLFRKKQSLSLRKYYIFSGIKAGSEKYSFGRFSIVLLHSPWYYKEAINGGADLVLSGHLHGGTIRVPKIGALMTPQYRFFVKECAGIIKYKNAHVIINRGLGTHTFNIRINDFPEISVVELRPEAGSSQ